MPQEQSRITARMPRAWRDAIVEHALANGLTLTDYACEQMLSGLDTSVRESLPAREIVPLGRNLLPTKKQEQEGGE